LFGIYVRKMPEARRTIDRTIGGELARIRGLGFERTGSNGVAGQNGKSGNFGNWS